MKHQALFSWNDKSKKLKCRLLHRASVQLSELPRLQDFDEYQYSAYTLQLTVITLEPWHDKTNYSRTSMARTLMARLPRLFRTRS